jgi:hypothetical protein
MSKTQKMMTTNASVFCAFAFLLHFFCSSMLFSLEVSLVVNLDGNLARVIINFWDDGSNIEADVYRVSDGSWEKAKTVSLTDRATDPRIAVIANGVDISVVVVWCEIVNEKSALYGAVRINKEVGWSPAVKISSDDEDVQGNHILCVNSNGNIILSWTTMLESGVEFKYASSSQMDGQNLWSSPAVVFKKVLN